MHLFCLLHSQGPLLERLSACLDTVLSNVQVEYFFALNSLFSRLSDPSCFAKTVLMVVADQQILDDMLNQQEVLAGLPLVLLVDDDGKGSLVKGHLLRPRFITGMDCDPETVIEVLRNLIRLQRQKNIPAANYLQV